MIKRNNKTKQKKEDGLKQTVFNNLYEAPVDLNKKYEFYGFIDFKDKPSLLTTYETRQRSEATAIFTREAKAAGGRLGYVGVLK